MNALVVIATRYGSTAQAARWIAERLELDGVKTEIHQAGDAPPPGKAELVVLGSGLYAHTLLPPLNDYIDRHIETLRQKKLGLFVLAMRTTPVFVRGKAHGGLAQLDYLFEKLAPAPIHADMLGGQMVYDRLGEEDAAGLDKFYAMLRLDPEEIRRRKAPRTLMNKADYWAFAETILDKTREDQ